MERNNDVLCKITKKDSPKLHIEKGIFGKE